MKALTERQLVCARLYYIEHMTQPAIAARLGISQPNVSKHIKRAIVKLRKALPKQQATDPARINALHARHIVAVF